MEDQKHEDQKEMLSEQSKKQAQFWLEYGQQLSAAKGTAIIRISKQAASKKLPRKMSAT